MMIKYLFSLNFFRIFSLFFALLSSSAIAEYQDTQYISKDGGFIICTKKGVEELSDIRQSQIDSKEVIRLTDYSVLNKVTQGECIFRNTRAIFKRIANEYSLKDSETTVSDEKGEENCPWNPLEKCTLINTSFVQYVESSFLDNDGIWYKGVFIEMGWDFELFDRPEDTQATEEEEDRTPDNTLSQ